MEEEVEELDLLYKCNNLNSLSLVVRVQDLYVLLRVGYTHLEI